MDWINTDFTLVGPIMFGNDRWLGEFSSFESARAAIRLKRGESDVKSELTAGDLDLLEAIDADEV